MATRSDYSQSNVGGHCRALRKKRGLTAQQLADRIGVKGAFVYDIESGRKVPSLDRFLRLSRALNVSPLALVKTPPAKPPEQGSYTQEAGATARAMPEPGPAESHPEVPSDG